MDGGDGDPQGACFIPVHVDAVFGHVRHAVGPDRGQPRVLGRYVQQLVLGLHQGLMAEPAPVQKLEVETLGHAQFHNGRRREDKDPGIADAPRALVARCATA